MEGFIEVSKYESIRVAAGKDSNVARLMEALGYGIGMLLRMLRQARDKSRQVAAEEKRIILI